MHSSKNRGEISDEKDLFSLNHTTAIAAYLMNSLPAFRGTDAILSVEVGHSIARASCNARSTSMRLLTPVALSGLTTALATAVAILSSGSALGALGLFSIGILILLKGRLDWETEKIQAYATLVRRCQEVKRELREALGEPQFNRGWLNNWNAIRQKAGVIFRSLRELEKQGRPSFVWGRALLVPAAMGLAIPTILPYLGAMTFALLVYYVLRDMKSLRSSANLLESLRCVNEPSTRITSEESARALREILSEPSMAQSQDPGLRRALGMESREAGVVLRRLHSAITWYEEGNEGRCHRLSEELSRRIQDPFLRKCVYDFCQDPSRPSWQSLLAMLSGQLFNARNGVIRMTGHTLDQPSQLRNLLRIFGLSEEEFAEELERLDAAAEQYTAAQAEAEAQMRDAAEAPRLRIILRETLAQLTVLEARWDEATAQIERELDHIAQERRRLQEAQAALRPMEPDPEDVIQAFSDMHMPS